MLELWQILVEVRWGELWKDRAVVLVTENIQVMVALNTDRSRNKTTTFWASTTYNFDVKSVYINTRVIVICDSLSRLDKFKNLARIQDVIQWVLIVLSQHL